MHRRKIFTTVVSAGLLLIPFTHGQFPGNKVDNGEGGGSGMDIDLAATIAQEAPPTQTTIAISAETSGVCDGPVKLLGLANTGPYLPVMIDGDGPFNFTISFDEEGTYAFSYRFCRDSLELNQNRCLFTGSTTEGGTDEGGNTINTGKTEFGFKSFNLSPTARIGNDDNHIVLDKYPMRVITRLESGSNDALKSRFGDGNIQGIIGLKNSGDFIQRLSLVCRASSSGWGIRLQRGSIFSFGGVDSMASAIGTNDTRNVLDFNSDFGIAEVEPVIDVFSGVRSAKFNTPVVLDTMIPFNTVPENIRNSVNDSSVTGASANIKINGVTFNIPWTSLVHSGSAIADSDNALILGAPFFEHVYAATFPGGRHNVVFAQDKGLPQAAFKPFSEVETNLPTKVQPDNAVGTSSSSGKPDTKIDNSSGDQAPSNDPSPAMAKSNNVGAIVGGVVGGVVGLFIILVAGCCFYRRRKLMKGSPRSVEKEYEAEFDAEIGHHDGFFPQFKESGYATLPTPPPPPSQARPQIPSLILGSPTNMQYDSQTEYTPTLHPYHDESPSRSLNVTPLPPPAQNPIITIPPIQERRLSITPSLSIEPPSPLSRNISAASRQNFQGALQLQRSRSNVRAVPEEDDYDVVSMTSVPAYNPIMASQEASSSAPRLPFMHRPESDRGMSMVDRGAGL